MKLNGIKLIEEYKKHPEKYLPLYYSTGQTPDVNEFGDVNIGWWAGLLDDNRPFFSECWATSGITMLTIAVSSEGIEDITAEDLDKMFQDSGYYKQREPGENIPMVDKFIGKDGNEYFTINLTVGVEDEPARIDGGWIKAWSILNEYNQEADGK